MIGIQILAAFFWMCIVPFLTGSVFSKLLLRQGKWNVFFVTATGLLIQYAFYEMLALAFIYLDKSFRLMSKLYALGALLLAFAGAVVLFFSRRALGSLRKDLSKEAAGNRGETLSQSVWKKGRPNGYLLTSFVLIAIQIVAILFWATPDADDAFYAGLSSMSIACDYVLKYSAYSGVMRAAIGRRYAISALPAYQATLQLLCGKLHHLFITHNLFPLFYMPLSYGLFYCIGGLFAQGEKELQYRYFFFFALLHLFGNTVVFSPQNFLVTRIWQGKALFACISLPYFYLLLDGLFGAKAWGQRMLWVLLLLAGFVGTVCMGETGLFLAPPMILALGAAHFFVRKVPFGRDKEGAV
ncbi:MAG: hypothetical protein J6P60_00680 [Lachnospiraceae bacterium]|nr:hypothetical protein [Lachnospiraceae bacterium]